MMEFDYFTVINKLTNEVVGIRNVEYQEADLVDWPEADYTYLPTTEEDMKVWCKVTNPIWDEVNLRVKAADSSIESLKERKVAIINSECEAQIVSGFASSALGSPHTYQSDRDDQLNLLGTYQAGVDSLFKCLPSNSEEWEWKLHTPEQLKQVIQDGAAYKSELLQRANLLKGQVKAATVKEELDSIAW